LIATWREIVEAAGSRLGLMSSNLETHSMEGRNWDAWWRALARRFPAAHRPHFWGYGEDPASVLVYGIGQLEQNRSVQPAGTESDPEIENFPYGPWNKSFRQLLAQMALAQVFGSDRLAVSVYDFMGNWPSDEPERGAFLGRVKPMLGWLGDQFGRALEPVGIGVPWHPDQSRRVHTDGTRDWRALGVNTRGWDHWFGPFGFAFQKRPHARVNALAGAMAWCFDEAQLRAWLERGLLLDGPAAAILVERGFGELIGITDTGFITQAEMLYSMEESIDAEFGLRPGAQMSLNAEKPYKHRLLQGVVLDGARVISVLRSPTQEQVGHGAFVFENGIGGRVAVMPWDATAGANLCTQRYAQIRKVVAWLGRGVSCGSVQGGAWLIPQFFTDGRTWRGVVWNASPDASRGFTVLPPEGMGSIARAVHCDADGAMIEAAVSGNRIETERAVHQWEFVVVGI
jgi:hypothetical protein